MDPFEKRCPLAQVVAPKRAALAEANRKLEGANKKLAGIRAKVKELQDRVATLEAGLMKATEDKNNAIAQVGGTKPWPVRARLSVNCSGTSRYKRHKYLWISRQ
jgi:hypothetical protein